MHILLFILIFIIAIFVFGLSIIGFILRTIFGLGRGSSSSRPKQTESGRTSQQDYSQRDRRSNMMMKMMYDNVNGIITDQLAELNETIKDFEDNRSYANKLLNFILILPDESAS